MNLRQIIESIILWLLIVMWTYTGISKLIDFASFRGAILNQPFPNEIGEYVSLVVPIIEVALALLLIGIRTRILGFVGSVALMSVFTTYVGLVWVGSFERIPCGCAGVIERLGWQAHFILNLFVLNLAMIGIMITKRK
ncbi:MauE/DoxX family redox-associated membrane protein [Belliella pelovolcani]|uniref:Methylamine utilisation protein MauE n=1 Tax=Belliella pelovolcani TaxID=529505 RepID=A0A1N7MK09_9BACT|nr:MauE/DoxX family redox-associated membrane protein [Belliella pelovolcani]SIS86504.1 Methylamine utilisation protein MauE [Belliella pelovolcani]